MTFILVNTLSGMNEITIASIYLYMYKDGSRKFQGGPARRREQSIRQGIPHFFCSHSTIHTRSYTNTGSSLPSVVSITESVFRENNAVDNTFVRISKFKIRHREYPMFILWSTTD